MKKIIMLLIMSFCASSSYGGNFVHPSNFDGSEEAKQKVLEYIKKNVEEDYSKIGMGDPLTLRTMEKEELRSFKKLTQVKNTELLNSVIKEYCDIGMCTYSVIDMMYEEQLQASKETLDW